MIKWEYEIKITKKLSSNAFWSYARYAIWNEIPGYFKWDLAQYVYAQWAGLYENLGDIYVNRGFGFHAYQVEWG
jgi:hypothetical protein